MSEILLLKVSLPVFLPPSSVPRFFMIPLPFNLAFPYPPWEKYGQELGPTRFLSAILSRGSDKPGWGLPRAENLPFKPSWNLRNVGLEL